MTQPRGQHEEDEGLAQDQAAATPMSGRLAHQFDGGSLPAICLIDPETWRLLAVDPTAAGYLKLDSVNLAACDIREVLTTLTVEQWSSIAANCGKSRQTYSVMDVMLPSSNARANFHFSCLSSPEQNWLLLAIQPRNTQAANSLTYDALTNLPDRRQLADYYSQLRHTRDAGARPIAVLFLDLDDFKQINDQHGHAAGDHILIQLASRWQNCLRDDDFVARYGGDEFVILLSGIATREEAQPILDRLANATLEPIAILEETFRIEVTIGIAFSNYANDRFEELIIEADHDMYAAKAKRKATRG